MTLTMSLNLTLTLLSIIISLNTNPNLNTTPNVTGYVKGNLDGETLTGIWDSFLIKYNNAGNKQWTKLSGVAAASTKSYKVVVDGNSPANIFLTGITEGNLDGIAKLGTKDAYLIKYNNAGVKQFTRLSGVATKPTQGRGMAVDASGNVYVAGYTEGSLDGQSLTGAQGAYLMKYDNVGNKQYTALQSVAGATAGRAVAVDGSGNVYSTGETTGPLHGKALTGSEDGFLARVVTAPITPTWTKLYGYTGADRREEALVYTSAITADACSGNIYVVGSMNGVLDGQLPTGNPDAYLIKYNSAGNKQFTKLSGVMGQSTYSKDVATDASGNVLVVGYATNTWGGQP